MLNLRLELTCLFSNHFYTTRSFLHGVENTVIFLAFTISMSTSMRYMQLVACTYLELGPRLNVQQCGSNSMCGVSTHQKLRSMITHVVEYYFAWVH